MAPLHVATLTVQRELPRLYLASMPFHYCLHSAAMEFLKSNPVDPVNRDAFEAFCGVGVVITQDQIAEKVCPGV